MAVIQINTNVSAELKNALEQIAVQNFSNRSAIVRKALAEYVERHQKNEPPAATTATAHDKGDSTSHVRTE